MSFFKRNLANFITVIRIIAAILLFVLTITGVFPHEKLTYGFFILYGICGLTDVIDGFVARKLKIESQAGAILDSISDLLFYATMLYCLFPTLVRCLPWYLWAIGITATVFHGIGYIICAFKFKTFSSLHTYADKILGFAVFGFPFFFIGEVFLVYAIYIFTFGTVAIWSGLEVCLIHIISKDYDTTNKSLFHLLKKKKETNSAAS